MTYVSLTPYFPSVKTIIGPFVYDQVRAVERTGRFDRIVVLKPFPWYVRRLQYEFGDVTVYGVRSFQLPSKILPDLFNALNRLFFFRRLRQLGIAGAFVLHIHTSPLAKYGVWAKRRWPGVVTWLQHHDLDPLLVRMGRLRKVRWHQRLGVARRVRNVSQMDVQICVSQIGLCQLQAFPRTIHQDFADYSHLLSLYKGLPSVVIRRAAVLYNGVDKSVFTPPMVPRPERGTMRIGCVGGFYDNKGQMDLIQAAEKLRERGVSDFEVVFVGVGAERPRCEAYVREHRLENLVRFEETRPHEALPDFFRSLDLFVLPSFFETFACVYFEAAACGVPFLCCEGQGNAEAIRVEDREKWLVEPHNPSQLADRIERFLRVRDHQQLAFDYDIDRLVGTFLDELLGTDAHLS